MHFTNKAIQKLFKKIKELVLLSLTLRSKNDYRYAYKKSSIRMKKTKLISQVT